MEVLNKNSALWTYLSENQRGLILDGEQLLDEVEDFNAKVYDYSFVVFPFAKAYEGFLKQFFLDLRLIREDEYYGDEIRIGRILNPNYMKKQKNVYYKICGPSQQSTVMANKLWTIWKKGRNQVFHYFPHNFRKLSKEEALILIQEFIDAMDDVLTKCDLLK